LSRTPAGLVAAWNDAEAAEGVAPAARSFLLPGSPDRAPVLLVHGGGGSPSDFRPLGAALAADGRAVLCPLLPAHGRGDLALAETRFEALRERAEEAFAVLAGPGAPRPALVGQSLGAVVGTCLAAEGVAGAGKPASFVALAPAFRPRVYRRTGQVLRLVLESPVRARASWVWQVRMRPAIRAARELLPRLECPLLVLHSSDDPTAHPRGGREMFERAGSDEKRFVALDGQGHVLSNAPDLERVADPIRAFLRREAPRGAG
jgi:carboxylesterase